MKTVKLELILPKWARWIATDASGRVFAYQVKPHLHSTYSIWVSNQIINQGRTGFTEVGTIKPPKDYRKTLKRL